MEFIKLVPSVVLAAGMSIASFGGNLYAEDANRAAFSRAKSASYDALLKLDAEIQREAEEEIKLVATVNAKADVAAIEKSVSVPQKVLAKYKIPAPKNISGKKANELITVGNEDPRAIIDDLLASVGLVEGDNANKGNVYISIGSATVTQPPGSDEYVNARVLAFAEAELHSRMKIAEFLEQEIISGRSFDKKRIKGPKKVKSMTKAQVITEKYKSIHEAELNKKLIELGEDPSKIDAKQKEQIYSKHMVKGAALKARAALKGCSVFATAEGSNDGASEIVVAVLWSPNLARLANFVLYQDPIDLPAKTRVGRNISEQIPKSVIKLIRQFGVKPCLDENGERVLLSFGQAGVEWDDDPEFRSENRSEAREMAYLEALSYLKEFTFEETNGSTSKSVESVMEKYKKADGSIENVKEFRKSYHQAIKSGGNAITLSGVVKRKTWTGKVDGKEIAGVIISWSPASMRRAQDYKKKMSEIQSGKDEAKKKQEDVKKRIKGSSGHSSTPDIGAW